MVKLTPLQQWQHIIYGDLEKAGRVLDDRERDTLKHCVIQRALIELGYRDHSVRKAG